MNVALPAILADAIGVKSIAVPPGTARAVLAALRSHPKLGPLIFDESRDLRRHVILFVNEVALQHLPSLDVPLTDADRIAVVQNVSGG